MSAKTSLKPAVAEMMRRWVRKADNDLLAVQRLLDSGGGCPYDVACYHCEQAAERYLKAILTSCATHAPKTHDIGHLADLLPPDCRLPLPREDLEYLSAYGIDSWWEPDRDQTLRAFDIATRLREEVRRRLPAEVLGQNAA